MIQVRNFTKIHRKYRKYRKHGNSIYVGNDKSYCINKQLNGVFYLKMIFFIHFILFFAIDI
jgi:hypothetical protein